MSNKILAVVTGAAPVLNGKQSGLYLSELTHFLDVVDNAGYDWDIASPAGGPITLDENSVTPRQRKQDVNARFLAKPEVQQALESSKACEDVDPADYESIYLAGGHGTMWDFRDSQPLQSLIAYLYDRGKPIAAVCHGVSGFVDAVDGDGNHIVTGRRVTGFTNLEDTLGRTKSAMPFLLEDALIEVGADFRKNRVPFTSRVEIDGPIITGQNPQSARAAGEALRQRLQDLDRQA